MYFGSGGKILFWSGDWREVHLRLRRNVWTYNYMGMIVGRSLWVDVGLVHAQIERTVYIADKLVYENRKQDRQSSRLDRKV